MNKYQAIDHHFYLKINIKIIANYEKQVVPRVCTRPNADINNQTVMNKVVTIFKISFFLNIFLGKNSLIDN